MYLKKWLHLFIKKHFSRFSKKLILFFNVFFEFYVINHKKAKKYLS